MDIISTNRTKEWTDSVEEDVKDVDEDFPPGSQQRGVFRDFSHAASKRQRMEQRKNTEVEGFKKGDDEEWVRNKDEMQSLKHLKLSFPVYKEASHSYNAPNWGPQVLVQILYEGRE